VFRAVQSSVEAKDARIVAVLPFDRLAALQKPRMLASGGSAPGRRICAGSGGSTIEVAGVSNQV
jgi:hypothetical protein